jgi:hypothetical protein
MNPLASSTAGNEIIDSLRSLNVQDNDRQSGESKVPSNAISLEDTISLDLVAAKIVAFVGPNQAFRTAYTASFPRTTTFNQVVSVNQAKLCISDFRNSQLGPQTLFSVMAKQNNLNVLNFVCSKEFYPFFTAQTATAAAQEGHFALLKWLVKKSCDVDESTAAAAAAFSDPSMLVWLRTLPEPCSWDESTCSTAARHGNFNVLQYARSIGCPWNEDTCAMAAPNGHLNCLQFAHSNSCPWNPDAIKNAARNGHLKVVHWILPAHYASSLS